MRVGVCTGGGDCPGLNAAIRYWQGCIRNGYEVYGIRIASGFKSQSTTLSSLEISDVTDIYFKGGTILGTYSKSGRSDADEKNPLEQIIKGYQILKLDCLLVVGGEGTQSTAKALSSAGLNIIGLPKTIDNDLPLTQRTIGFSTCIDLVSESVTRLQSTAESHDRIMILEVMGRDSGFIGLYGGLAGGAHVILIPEIPFSFEKF